MSVTVESDTNNQFIAIFMGVGFLVLALGFFVCKKDGKKDTSNVYAQYGVS